MLKVTFEEISGIVLVEISEGTMEGFSRVIPSGILAEIAWEIPRNVLEGISDGTPRRKLGEIMEKSLKNSQINFRKNLKKKLLKETLREIFRIIFGKFANKNSDSFPENSWERSEINF